MPVRLMITDENVGIEIFADYSKRVYFDNNLF